jgi:hypothetical protein
MLFGVMFVGGAGALALWIDARFPGMTPQQIQRTLIHVAVAFAVCRLASPLVSDFIVGTGVPLARLAALMLVVLPTLMYGILAAIWLVKHAQDPMRSMMR